MSPEILLAPILIPCAIGLLILVLPRWLSRSEGILALLGTLAALWVAILVFGVGAPIRCVHPWAGFGINLDLSAPHFARFVLLAATGFEVLIALYSISFMKDKWRSQEYFAYLLLNNEHRHTVILVYPLNGFKSRLHEPRSKTK